MDARENSYLLFFSAGFHFLLPLAWVKRVAGMSERDPELPVTDFGGILSEADMLYQNYLVIAECGSREFGIGAEKVAGLVNVEEQQVFDIPEEVRDSRNRYLDGMAAVDTADGESVLAFIVDPDRLAPLPSP